MLLGQSSPPASSLPPDAQVRVLVIILGVAALALLGLLVLTALRRLLRRSSIDRPRRDAAEKPSRALSPWEQAGRRAAPVNESAPEKGDDTHTPEPDR